MLLLILAARYCERFFGLSLLSSARNLIAVSVAALALGLASLVTGLPLRLAGAFAAGMLATEASLVAMERWKVPLRGVVEAFIVVRLGGIVIAGSFSVPRYM